MGGAASRVRPGAWWRERRPTLSNGPARSTAPAAVTLGERLPQALVALAIGSLLCGTGKLGALVMFCQGTENPAGSHLLRKDIGVHLMSPREDESQEQTASPRCHRWPRTAGPDGRVLSAGRGRHVHPAPRLPVH